MTLTNPVADVSQNVLTIPNKVLSVDAGGNVHTLGQQLAAVSLPFVHASDKGIGMADGPKATYSAAKVGLVPANSATDIFTITGSATKTIRVTRIEISGTTTSATPAALDVMLLKRSTADTGGTSTGSPTVVPHDSANAAATATVLAYTANPTVGTLVGTAIRNQKYLLALATSTATDFPQVDHLVWEFGNRPGQSLVLRGIADVLAINLNGVTATATASLDIAVEFTEE